MFLFFSGKNPESEKYHPGQDLISLATSSITSHGRETETSEPSSSLTNQVQNQSVFYNSTTDVYVKNMESKTKQLTTHSPSVSAETSRNLYAEMQSVRTIDRITTRNSVDISDGDESLDEKRLTKSLLQKEGIETEDLKTTELHLTTEGTEPMERITTEAYMSTEGTKTLTKVTKEESPLVSDKTSKEYMRIPEESSTLQEGPSSNRPMKLYKSPYTTVKTSTDILNGSPDVKLATTETQDQATIQDGALTTFQYAQVTTNSENNKATILPTLKDKTTQRSTTWLAPNFTWNKSKITRPSTIVTVSSTKLQPGDETESTSRLHTALASSSTTREYQEADSGKFQSSLLSMWDSWWIAVIVLGLMVIILSIILIMVLVRNERKRGSRRFAGLNHPIL